MGAQHALVTRQAGYGLFVRPDQVDACQFEHLLGLGRQALGLGEAERAARLLAEALSLWRGSVLDDLGPPEFASAERRRGSRSFGWTRWITALMPISHWAGTTR